MEYLRKTSLVLTIIGALNWGLVGFFDFNLVAFLFGSMSILSRIIYMLVGLSALVVAYSAATCCPYGRAFCKRNQQISPVLSLSEGENNFSVIKD